MELLLEPLSHAFMVKALMISALVGGVCGLLSCFMTLKGWALMGDAVSHAVLPGVVVAYALGLPFSLGAFVFGVGSVAAIGFVKQKSRVKEDTVIGLVFTGFFALGLVLVSKTRSNIDLTHILFGNVLGISAGDVQQTLVISVLVLVLLLLFRRDLMLFCFDPTHARSIGINTGLLHYMLLGLLSLAAVAGLQTVGIILVVSMLVTPGATAYLLTDRFRPDDAAGRHQQRALQCAGGVHQLLDRQLHRRLHRAGANRAIRARLPSCTWAGVLRRL
ncbi:MAG: hypothetical protein CM15mP39_01370 [Synechococcus sp.]|nr:MAG: hypothetical protein CM15mP39_01370 [Synechococcus sp.]